MTLAPAREDRSTARTTYLPADALFFAMLAFAVLPVAPGLVVFSNLAPVPVFAVLAVLWLLALLRPGIQVRGLWMFGSLALVGLAGAATSDAGATVAVWAVVLLVPLLMFAGLQMATEDSVVRARQSARWVLMATCAWQVVAFVAVTGVRPALSPSFVLEHHSDVSLWEATGGQVLANPNNASVILCAGFGWAVGERALGRRGLVSWAFLAVSLWAVFVTGSRGAYLAAAIIVVVAAWSKRSTGTRLLTIGAVSVAGYQAWKLLAGSEYVAGVDISLETRLEARRAGLSMAFEPFGHGVGTTAEALRHVLRPIHFVGSDREGATSHDMFINWSVAVGPLGLVLFVAALWVAYKRGRERWGFLSLLPLVAYVVAGEAAGADVLTPTNAAWSAVLWSLVGIAWRGGIVPAVPRTPSEPEIRPRVRSRVRTLR